ncbi:MAG: S46 family peptidase [Flavobacteriales bacterium]|nr:S46 family peptidase [Flavobacteriales bacterium]MCB9167644.1 S46 family peptidase [Flavobacteriales bacterium]
MKKLYLLLAAAILVSSTASAHEGMWLLNKLQQVNESQMRELGFKLTAQDIYDINKSSLKDAVVRMGPGFCSAEMVSEQGLFLTNHHCGYDAIQGFSSVDHDYLTDGFWAMTRDQELNVPGLTVSYLVRIDDVTERVLAELSADMSEADREAKIDELAQTIQGEVSTDNGMSATLKTMFEGNEFYLFVYKTYRDVRLVGAPPSAIGKFGGDTDNWMWPRHTGDFSMFRVYTGKDGEPADYSADNVPYRPKWHFPVSLNGVKEGDFAMIMGYPGSTDRFLCSAGVELALDVEQPSRVKIRGEKLDLMKEDMDADPAVRIQYASKYAQVSNYWKYFIGQQRGLKRLHVYDKKKKQEDELLTWVNADPDRKGDWGEFLTLLDNGYAERAKFEKATTYMQEAAFGSEMVIMGFRMYGLLNQLRTDPNDAAKVAAQVARVQAAADDFFKDYHAPTDQKITAAMFRMIHEDVDRDLQPSVMGTVEKKFKGDFTKWAAKLFSTSVLTDRTRLDAFLAKPNLKTLDKDMGMQTMESCLMHYRAMLGPAVDAAQVDIDKGYRLMVAAMRAKAPQKMWYPNANSTMRLTYGVVGGYHPADAVYYDMQTTYRGILEKEDNTNDEFVVPAREHELLSKRDFGRYANANGDLDVCFLSNNDITGGNSGSPVLNAYGELIGIAFDGNWEAMSGDIAFEPELQRTISVDIRYVLWVIDKYAGAGHLVNEMTLVTKPHEDAADADAAPTNGAQLPAGTKAMN